MRSADGKPSEQLSIAGRLLTPTEVFDTYWHFAAARHETYLRRLAGAAPPWTDDPILKGYRFTNAYRAADRVSQFLISEVIYGQKSPNDAENNVFRILLFKLFNRISTWSALESHVGEVLWTTYDFARYARALDSAAARGPVYSAAYVIPPPRLGERTKRLDHLRLIEIIMHDQFSTMIEGAFDLKAVYMRLRSYPSIGPFLAYQFAIDLNYSPFMAAEEDQFVVAGPGARDGVRKCFGPASEGIEADIIRYVTETQEAHFTRLGLRFAGLFGRPLQLIDCQNLFCEVDKYARVAHPSVRGVSGRSRIKQKFTPLATPVTAFFPPKWKLSAPPRRRSSQGVGQPSLFT
jgi:alpha-glutamyl/putrescinyl thymine pyrophosphorylase clade 1